MMKPILPIALLVCVIFSPIALALEEFYSISRSVRALGMGGTNYALSSDQYALFYNPAGLSVYEYPSSQVMLGLQGQTAPQTLGAISTLTKSSSNISTVVSSLEKYTGKPLYAGFNVMPFYVGKNFGLALLLADAKTDFAILGNQISSEIDLTVISDSGLVAGYAMRIPNTDLHVGANVKGLIRAGGRKQFSVLDVAQSNAFDLTPQELGGVGFGVDVDLGAIYDLPNLPFGLRNRVSLSINNLLASRFTIARQYGPPPGLPRMLSVGYATVLPGWQFIDEFRLALDFAEFQLGGDNAAADLGGRTGNFLKHVNLGAEMPMNQFFALRLGIHQGYPTAGIGVNFKLLKLDLAYYAEEVSRHPGRLASHRFAFNLTLGGGSSAPEPLQRIKAREESTTAAETAPAPEVETIKIDKDGANK